ncbi:LysR family transcriptional regulator [Actinocrispum wychmicini]|uniref:DNA-binding transcriptional LysR family regulator n=1 Tax=Actinocrispum wychmicini TaxID=1213861 RepID=A0A4R2J3I9_9PSEU|nr:LysR family transcriptional regulator [Actinocrispum wychmicini]TCO53101.1 DNA-binding transcriptional LysR family regulator [Actinocrispum wychmicini]
MDSRELGYFVAVAEELHFGRAAERLGIAQPPLSRAIKQLEHRLGVALFERTSRKVVLTAAGEVLFHEGRKALDALSAATLRTQRAGEPRPRLVLVMKPAGDSALLDSILAAYAEDADSIPVELSVCGIGEQSGILRDGRADVALLHAPYDDMSGFDTEELHSEDSVAVLPRGHRLADCDHLIMADMAGETFPRWPGKPGSGPLVRDSAQLLLLVALGRTIAVLPESVRAHLRDDLVTVPVLDGPVTTTVVAWPERSRSRAVAAFVRAATRSVDLAGRGSYIEHERYEDAAHGTWTG